MSTNYVNLYKVTYWEYNQDPNIAPVQKDAYVDELFHLQKYKGRIIGVIPMEVNYLPPMTAEMIEQIYAMIDKNIQQTKG